MLITSPSGWHHLGEPGPPVPKTNQGFATYFGPNLRARTSWTFFSYRMPWARRPLARWGLHHLGAQRESFAHSTRPAGLKLVLLCWGWEEFGFGLGTEARFGFDRPELFDLLAGFGEGRRINDIDIFDLCRGDGTGLGSPLRGKA